MTTQYMADFDANGVLIGQGLYQVGVDQTIPNTAVPVSQSVWDHWTANLPLRLVNGNFMLPFPPVLTPAQQVAAAVNGFQAYLASVYTSGIMFQSAAMLATTPQTPAVAFPLDVAGRATIDQAYLSATQSPTLWTDGTPISSASGPVPMTNADVLTLGRKATAYVQKVATYAASQLQKIEANPAYVYTTGWPSNA